MVIIMEIYEKYPMFSVEQKYGVFASPEELLMVKTVREYVDREILPRRLDLEGGWCRDERLAEETLDLVYKGLVDLGVQKLLIPSKYGGIEISPVGAMIIKEEVARGDPGVSLHMSIIHWVISIIRGAKRDDLMKMFAEKLVGSDPWTACVAITEPIGGANIEDPSQEFTAVSTQAKLDGDEYVINGHKIWPGPAGPSEIFKRKNLKGHLGYIVLATTDPSKGEEGIGLFYVPPDEKGLNFSKPFEKMGMCHTDRNVEIWFKDVRIPKEYCIVGPGKEAANVIKGYVIAGGRLATAAFAVGAAQGALEIVLEWTKNRKIVGKPMRERSVFASILGEIMKRVEAARIYYLTVAHMMRKRDIYGPPWSSEMLARCSAARSLAADTSLWVIDKAIELMGSYGYAFENKVEKYYRDAKILQLWLGGPYRDRLDIAYGVYGPFKWAKE